MNTRKLLFITIGTVFFIVIISFFLFLSFKNSAPSSQNPPGNTTPTIVNENPSLLGLLLVSTNPVNQEGNIQTSIKPAFVFNKTLASQPFIAITPNVPFTFSTTGNTLTISPNETLNPSTNYTVSAHLENRTFLLFFTTAGPTPTPGSSTRPVDQINQEQLTLRTNYPDVYLSQKTPYNNFEFSVTSSLQNAGNFSFTVTPKTSQASARSSFGTWAKEQGLTDSQIASLEVVYK